jgi:hypothetical protein
MMAQERSARFLEVASSRDNGADLIKRMADVIALAERSRIFATPVQTIILITEARDMSQIERLARETLNVGETLRMGASWTP